MGSLGKPNKNGYNTSTRRISNSELVQLACQTTVSLPQAIARAANSTLVASLGNIFAFTH